MASFLNDVSSASHGLSDLERRPAPETAELVASLPGQDERALFLKTAWLLAWADGAVSPGERKLIETYGAALGVTGTALSHLEDNVKEYLLGQLSHVQNTDATREVAQKLKV